MVVERPRRAVAPLLILALSSLASGGAYAGANELFTVTDVKVDATAATAAAAREVALPEGQSQALGILLRRLTLRADHANLPVPPNHRVAELVMALEIAAERTSAVRYLARLTVRFKPEEVRLLLRLANVPFAETVRRPELVLPVYRIVGVPLLWDEPNPWKDAWAAGTAGVNLVPLTVPIGDLSDMSDISAEDAVRGNVERLDAIARRYGAGATLVVIATPAVDLVTGLPALTVVARRHDGEAGGTVIFERRFAGDGVTVDALMVSAVDAVTREVEEAWKQMNLLRFDLPGQLQVSVPVGSIEEWIDVRGRLARVAAIRDAELKGLTRSQVSLLLDYVGEVPQLTLALAQQDLELSQGLGSWTLRLRGAPAAETAAETTDEITDETAEAARNGTGRRPGPLPDRPLFQNTQ